MMINDSYLVRKGQCPRCAQEGRDMSKDNLMEYSDGHSYCFSGHGLINGTNTITNFLAGVDTPMPLSEIIVLPIDCDVSYPKKALDWVGQYTLNRSDLLNHNVLWSESIQRLIFPIYGDSGIIAWQGRWFGEGDNVKWFGRGNLKDTYNIMGTGGTLVLVEDVLSAMKIEKAGGMAMPLYGNAIGVERFTRLYRLFGKEIVVKIWLDPDMRRQSLLEQRKGLLCGLDVRIIYSELDPKEHSIEYIKGETK